MRFQTILTVLNGQKYRYVAVTIMVSLLAFARNILFMGTLDLAALGQITVMQTLVMLVGFVQFGLINGAYVQYAMRDLDVNRRIVELMATCLIVLVFVAIFGATIWQAFDLAVDVIWHETLVFGLAAGICTLASTWLNNALVADGRLGLSNAINLGAVVISMLVAFLAQGQGLIAALLSLLLQPMLIALFAMVVEPSLRPRSLGIQRETFSILFRLGIMPFLSGLAVLAMQQVERWSIAAALGSEALGHFYIVLMYSTFFGLIPASLLNVFIPQARRAYTSQHTLLFLSIVQRHFRGLLIYFAVAVLSTVVFLHLIVGHLPAHFGENVNLIFYALPALLLLTFRDSASLVLYASGKMRPLLIAAVLTLCFFCVCLVTLWLLNGFSLGSLLIARAFSTLPGTIFLIFSQRRQINIFGEKKIR